MFKNYLKIAWRSLSKNKGYSALNIFGLAIGITCASLIFLWVEDELKYDDAFDNRAHISHVIVNNKFEGEWRTFGDTPGPLAQDLKDEIPEVNHAARASNGEVLFTVGDQVIKRSGVYVDKDFIDIFTPRFLEGNGEIALTRPDAMVLTQKTATTLFGNNVSALNKTVRVNNKHTYVVTGVIADLPENTSLRFEWLAPFERFNEGEDNGWMNVYGNNFTNTFVVLDPKADYATINQKVRKLLPEKLEYPNAYFFLHPMKDWHLRSNFEYGKKVGGQIVFVKSMVVIALIILLIACINFMNLATARSQKRAKEVGLRKVLGSGKKKLVYQFMAESLITSVLAAIVSIFLLSLLLPEFNMLIEKNLELGIFDIQHFLFLLGVTLISGMLAGWYPAFYLSSFKPSEVFKGIKAKQGGAGMIRKGLVIAQFTVSILFIIGTIIVYQQIQHVKGRELGFVKENLIRIPVSGDMTKNFDAIKAEMTASPVIEGVAMVNTRVLSDGQNGNNLTWQGGVNTEDVLISFRYISSDFLKTAGMEIVEGRGFSDNIAMDSTNTLISQSFARLMGNGSVLGKTINRYGTNYQIIGVVKDYLFGNMYGTSDPVMFFNDPTRAEQMYVKVKPDIAMDRKLAAIGDILKKYNPSFPFEYEFVNDSFNSKFKGEKMIGNLSWMFALLAIIISCLGLFGLAAYTAEQRKKEIGVRKVLGSSVVGIVKLLSLDFLRLVIMALFISGPLAWWILNNWLNGFEYRIEIGWWVFVLAGSLAIGIALFTVSFHALKASLANPANSLHTE